MNETQLNLRPSNVKNLVFVDGYMRSGKTLVAAIAASLENVEMWQTLESVENIPVYFGLGRMELDAAAQSVQIDIDTYFYYSMIGRRVNFRRGDDSSIWKYRDPSVYVNRAEAPDERDALAAIETAPPISLIFTHDILCNPEPAFTAYANLKIVHMRRNPIDIAHSWFRKDWPSRIGEDATATAPSIRTPRGNAPWYAAEWAEEYDDLPTGDRIARCLDWLHSRSEQKRQELGKMANNVLDVCFEAIVSDPSPEVDRMCSFMRTVPSEHTDEILVRERIPRVLDPEDQTRKLDDLEKVCSGEGYALLRQLADQYEEKGERQ